MKYSLNIIQNEMLDLLTREEIGMKRFVAVILAIAIMISMFPMKAEVEVANSENLCFDFGGAGVEEGYIGVSEKDAYKIQKPWMRMCDIYTITLQGFVDWNGICW